MSLLQPQREALRHIQAREAVGTITTVRGLTILVDDLPLPIGSLVRIDRARSTAKTSQSGVSCWGEIIGFDGSQCIVMLMAGSEGISPGTRVKGEQTAQMVRVGRSMLGRIVDGLGQPIDGRPLPADTVARPLHPKLTNALDRKIIAEPLPTGVRAIDAMLTLGKGQRVGVFSGPGVGKSTLLSTIARNTVADVNVIALVGERGREVRHFIEESLGKEGLARSVIVVATGDQSPLLRVRAAMVAATIAEHFRELGSDVMLMMDSITRFAQAQRQIGLAVGEQPATKGYTPSVFALLPMLLERAGAVEKGGSVTGLYTVLVEGDDLTEPVSDSARGTLDGHIILSRKLAARGHYPAIDLLDSISRVSDDVCDNNHISARRDILRLVAAYRESEELINIGAYARGSNSDIDVAIAMKDQLEAFLQQPSTDSEDYPHTCRRLIELSAFAQETAATMQRAAMAAQS